MTAELKKFHNTEGQNLFVIKNLYCRNRIKKNRKQGALNKDRSD
jgi:hypothetical protein